MISPERPPDTRSTLVADSTVVLEGPGIPVRRALPSSAATYDLVDPFLLLDDARLSIGEDAPSFSKHPHRGFEIVTYMLLGSMGHMAEDGETSEIRAGGLLRLTAGRGMWHGEGSGAESPGEIHALQLWINLARAQKGIEPSYQVVEPGQIPVHTEDGATVRVLVGDGSPTVLQTPALYLDIALAGSSSYTKAIPEGFQGFVYLLNGAGHFGAERIVAAKGQLVVLGSDPELTVGQAEPGTRFILCAGRPHREEPRWRGPYVD